ncbi:hypothetical protein AKJ09_11222 [Labilithrix luteola]|uniref:Uncharacterized protein n=1 Tax=Labilithrix luteola TaxID=1391654 RepID=A0A0K1QFL5_9BACT|nr:hypothetical protein AKJ09_11222 [Labilithrix luteola]
MTIQGAGSAVHSQHDGERPCSSRTKYLRVWKAGHDAGDPEVWAEGRDRRMTPDAWRRYARSTALLVGKPANETSVDDSVHAELGVRRAS